MECVAVSFCQTKRIIGAMCRGQLEKGFLGGRYLVGRSTILELHQAPTEFMEYMLAGSASDVKGIPYLLFHEEDITYIICGTFLFDVVSKCRLHADSRIVYFLVPEQLNKAIKKIVDNGEKFECVPIPIMWTNVSEAKKRSIEIFIRGIRMGNASGKDDLFLGIADEELYSVLRLDRLHLLEDYEPPMKCKHYIGRQLIELQNTTGGKLNDDAFIYDNQNKRVGPILIGGNCGIGKSEFLKSVAEKIGNDKRRTVLIISIGSLEKVLNRSNIVKVICERVYGKGYRSRLLAFYLSEIPNLEVMLDGVDENFVCRMQMVDLLDALEYLKVQLPLSRLWVTFNDTTLLEYFSEQLGVSAYKLENFTYDEIVNFLVGMWSNIHLEGGARLSQIQWKDMLSFAEACSVQIICIVLKLADIPIICWLVGNYMEEQVLQKKFELKKATFSIDQLYLAFLGKGYEAVLENISYPYDTHPETPIALNVDQLAFETIFPEFSNAYKNMDIEDLVVVNCDPVAWMGTNHCQPPTFTHQSFAEFHVSNRIFRFIERIVSSKIGGLKQLDKCIYDLIKVLGKYCSTSIVNDYQPAHLSVAKFLNLQLGRMEGWSNNIDNSETLYPNLFTLVEVIQSRCTNLKVRRAISIV